MAAKPPAVPPLASDRALLIARGILEQPTAPFHEHRVRTAIASALDRIGVPWSLDAAGNLVARYRRGKAAPAAFVAHMDHPGFELAKVRGHEAEARWNGQVPTFDLRGRRLVLWSDGPEGRRGEATVLDGDGRRPREKAAVLRLRVPRGARPGDFGYASLPPFERRGGRIVSKALDNVGGCAAIVAAFDHLVRKKLPGNVTALFTRAEEVGFHGTLAAIRLGTIPRSVPVVVLECSKAMPGAEMGKGPVIRVGDRVTVFDPDLAAACEFAARDCAPPGKGPRWQRRLMDGGACESSAFGLSGYRTVCLAFPLGNYHNVGPRAVSPEYIAEGDFLDGARLLAAFAARGLDFRAARRRLVRWLGSRFGAAEMRRLRAGAQEARA